jgi:hypothetical protein
MHLHLEDAVVTLHFEKIGELLTVILKTRTSYESITLIAHGFVLQQSPPRDSAVYIASLFGGLFAQRLVTQPLGYSGPSSFKGGITSSAESRRLFSAAAIGIGLGGVEYIFDRIFS